MKQNVRIIRVGKEMSGVSERGNWKIRELEVAWKETAPTGEEFEQCVLASMNGDTNLEALEYHANNGTYFIANLYFGISSNNTGRSFNRIRIHFPHRNPNEVQPL